MSEPKDRDALKLMWFMLTGRFIDDEFADKIIALWDSPEVKQALADLREAHEVSHE